MVKLPWIPTEQQWLELLEVFRKEPVRNRLMLALAYDTALRQEGNRLSSRTNLTASTWSRRQDPV
jgi:hypothetical protein